MQTVGLNFKADQYGSVVPPDTQLAVGPAQIVALSNRGIKTFNKSTGAADGALDTTLNTFFASVNGGTTTFDGMIRYDRHSQRYIVTAENGTTPNKIFIAVSNGSAITSASAWTFYAFQINLVTPTGDATCFADYPTSGIDANAIIIGVNNFCPTSYASSAVYVVRKSSILSGGPIVVTVFRNVGQVTPRGVDSWDPDVGGTASSYFLSVVTTTSLRLRRISTPGGTPALSGNLDIAVPTVATPIALEHLGNAHPGGTFDGKVDASDTRIQPAVIRNGALWVTHGTRANSTGAGSGTGDRVAARWYQFNNLDTVPTLTQTGTIFDAAPTNPLSPTYSTVGVSGQGHAVFGFSLIGALQYNGGGYATRLVDDAAGTTSALASFVAGVGPYNPFDLGTSRAKRWGDYSRTVADPCDDMSIWTAQEFTALGNTTGLNNAQWGIQAARIIAPPPATPTAASPAGVAPGLASVNVVITGVSSNGSGFYDTPSTNNDACRTRLTAAASGGVVINSVTYTDPTLVTLNISTLGASAGPVNITITNPDGQSAIGTAILTVFNATTTMLVPSSSPVPAGTSVTLTATVTGTNPTGTVAFKLLNPVLPGCAAVALIGSGNVRAAQCTTPALTSGAYTFTANYGGDAGNGPSSASTAVIVSPVAGSACAGFTDVDSGDAFCPNVDWLRNRGVTLGCTSTSVYCPANPVSRLQMAAFMTRLGAALTTVPVAVESSTGTLNPNASPVVCSTGVITATNFARAAVVDGVFVAQGAEVGAVAVEVTASSDGVTWLPISPAMPVGLKVGRWSNVRAQANYDFVAGENVRFGLRVTRVAGTVNLTASQCQLLVQMGNRNTTYSPFDSAQ